MSRWSSGARLSVGAGAGSGYSNRANALVHPLWWVALVLLIANDHLLKGSGFLPAVVTGKLSDFAGLIVAPAVLCGLLGLDRRVPRAGAYALVGVVFAAMNLVPAVANMWTALLGSVGIPFRVWPDPTDLIALPALLVAFVLFEKPPVQGAKCKSWIPIAPKVAAMLGAAACLASSPWPVASPTVAQDRVYVEHVDGAVFVLDERDGSLIRALRATGQNDGPPAIFDRILYQVQPDGRITGIHVDNPQDPFPLSKHANPNTWIRILAVDAHRLYISAGDGRIYGIARSTGAVAWGVDARTEGLEDLPIFGDLAFVSEGKRLRAISVLDGRVLWSYTAKKSVGPAVVKGNRVYVASADGIVHGLDLGNGQKVWGYDAGSGACGSGNPRVFVGAGSVYSCFGGKTHAVALSNSKLQWRADGKAVAISGDVVVVKRSGNTLEGVSAKTGKSVWSRKLDGNLVANPTASGSLVFVRVGSGKLHAVDAVSGAVRWSFDWPKNESTAVGMSTSVVAN
ncbi:MAG: PQQ-like beta-propeller repeat protein [Polyangiaceae bacterium]|nr:PQQ-like beta-propeller repeat protein [Polyangiaceae bacterium]